jgi:hypothetical protein
MGINPDFMWMTKQYGFQEKTPVENSLIFSNYPHKSVERNTWR